MPKFTDLSAKILFLLENAVLLMSLFLVFWGGLFGISTVSVSVYLVLLVVPAAGALLLNAMRPCGNHAKYLFARRCAAVFLATYLLMLLYLLFFNYLRIKSVPESFGEYLISHTNLIPFRTIGEMLRFVLRSGSLLALVNILGNLCLLVPPGLLLPLFSPAAASSRRFFLLMAGSILAIELLQLVFRVGRFDIDDLILNLAGAMTAHSLGQTPPIQRILFLLHLLPHTVD